MHFSVGDVLGEASRSDVHHPFPPLAYGSLSATFALDGKSLDKLQAKYNAAVAGLETAQFKLATAKDGARPQHKEGAKCFCIGGAKVDSVEHYTQLVDKLQRELAEARGKALPHSQTGEVTTYL